MTLRLEYPLVVQCAPRASGDEPMRNRVPHSAGEKKQVTAGFLVLVLPALAGMSLIC